MGALLTVYMPHSQNLNYEFGPYRFNLVLLRLTREGEKISLTPKAAEILALLVTNAGQLVAKDFLLNQVWPNTFVEDANLAQNIFLLRRALGDERDGPKYIETVARRGYRFIATVRVFDAEESDREAVESATEAKDGTGAGSKRIVIAVLPFVNATGDPNVEYLSEGVADSIINNLARVSQLRVMSRSAVFRHRKDVFDPLVVGRELGAKAVLVGQISARPAGIAIGVELVEVAKGWQLWGETFDCELKDILEVQDTITRQLLVNLKLKLSGEEEKRITARYTENAEAYQAYLEGRYHWSLYTRTGIEKAIGHFRQAIELDPNYALAYAAIVDCYLRLATNYLPPEGEISTPKLDSFDTSISMTQSDPKVKLRFAWDWKGAERELRRANELKTTYPAAHQWYAAYGICQEIHRLSSGTYLNNSSESTKDWVPHKTVPDQVALLQPTRDEQVQVSCSIAREQIDAGNYDAAYIVLQPWWRYGERPKLDGLEERSCADLLFTAGELAGCLASAKQLPRGQKDGEALLNGSIAVFEQLSSPTRAAEARIELALCYYRQGLFDLGRSTLKIVLDALSPDDNELRSLALIRLASLERHAGRLQEALAYLMEASLVVELAGPWATGRRHLEVASTFKDLAISEENQMYFRQAQESYLRALHEFEGVGNHRLVAIVENNLGFLFIPMGRFLDAEFHLLRAQQAFSHFNDQIRCAQVDDSLARLFLAQRKYDEARLAIERAVSTMERGDEDVLLAESLRTMGRIYCALSRYNEAQKVLDGAYRLAYRRGDTEGAARALLIIVEEMGELLEPEERGRMQRVLTEVLSTSQQPAVTTRIKKCLEKIGLLA
ncbi:MAG TPA: winged helix-turn-helix domain-containing protein [Pyrinomonadaceae bacterium]|nr:winged helix-turn-helix domain-containing protein [Pyrinomonadaceae bacterium]